MLTDAVGSTWAYAIAMSLQYLFGVVIISFAFYIRGAIAFHAIAVGLLWPLLGIYLIVSIPFDFISSFVKWTWRKLFGTTT